MDIIIKIIMLIICIPLLITTFRTEYVLKAFFRVDEPSEKLIMRAKFIALCVAAALFIIVFTVF